MKQSDTFKPPIFFNMIETFCPICQAPVKKIKEVESEIKRSNSDCWNEFYIHTNKGILYKILNPKTPWS
jgi:uncharacterized Zn finger protein (UPF0148 family)